MLQQLVTQVAHGFTVGQVVTFRGTQFHLSQANSLLNCQGVLIVMNVVDADHFWVCQDGYLMDLPLLFVEGDQYYVDPATPGALTAVQPSVTGQVSLPCFVADSTTSGYFYTGSGTLVTSPLTPTIVNVTTATQAMTANTTYIVNYTVGQCTLTLPVAANQGDTIDIIGGEAGNAAGWKIAQNASQYIRDISSVTTTGVTGTLTTTNQYQSIEIMCSNPSDAHAWSVINQQGAFVGA